jgi:drug/metabolite transporter (DMT)-like permease
LTPASRVAPYLPLVFGSAIPTAAFAYSMPHLGPSAYGIVASTELLTAVAIGVAILGELLSALQVFGAICRG